MNEINFDDILPGDRIETNRERAVATIGGKVVMITGAAGSIGSELIRQTAELSPSQLILIDQAETPLHDIRLLMKNKWPDIKAYTIVANISDPVYMRRIFDEFKPEIVFHVAAYKHVPMMEDNPYEAVINNVYGTKVIADIAKEFETGKFVMISSDKALNPTNVMGCSKRICEIYLQSLDKAIKDGEVAGKTEFSSTRFGNVIGSSGSVIPIFMEQIKKDGPLTVTHKDMMRYFMPTSDACRLIIESAAISKGGEIFVFDMGEPIRISDLAKRMVELSGKENIKIEYTGLRDGEKIFEEVFSDKETYASTSHPKIKIANVREYDYCTAEHMIDSLIKDTAFLDDMGIVAEMKRIVPEFKSKHSKYQVLDTNT